MQSPRFFIASALPRPLTTPVEIQLGDGVAQHVRVLRLTPGDALTLFDGAGGEYSATLLSIGKREVQVRLDNWLPVERESDLSVTLVQALATGDKMDWIIQKAVEMGVFAIQPVQSSRATARLSAERAAKRAKHWESIVIAACEQCGRNRLPAVLPVCELTDWLARSSPTPTRRIMLEPMAATDLKAALAQVTVDAPIALLIGPEGGFSADEIDLARRHGVASAHLGSRILRTETAGLAALAVLQALAGDWASVPANEATNAGRAL